jgi:diadenosine tetraphosphate (Ap4A) HIT family hydrolase
VFCDQRWMRAAEIFIETPHCVFASTRDPRADTQDLLLRARMALHDLLVPDGYLLGWNQGGVLHPHMHVIPRFDDEPLSDRWLRSAINLPGNRRPDPWAPGSGRAFRDAR